MHNNIWGNIAQHGDRKGRHVSSQTFLWSSWGQGHLSEEAEGDNEILWDAYEELLLNLMFGSTSPLNIMCLLSAVPQLFFCVCLKWMLFKCCWFRTNTNPPTSLTLLQTQFQGTPDHSNEYAMQPYLSSFENESCIRPGLYLEWLISNRSPHWH